MHTNNATTNTTNTTNTTIKAPSIWRSRHIDSTAPAWRPVRIVEENRDRFDQAVRQRLRGVATDETEALADAIADAVAVWDLDAALPEKGAKNKNFGVRLAGTDIMTAPEPPENLEDVPAYPQALVEGLAAAVAGKFQVVVKSAKVPTSWKWTSGRRYEHIGLVETSPETMVRRDRRYSDIRMISERSIGVIRIVDEDDWLYAGKTERCESNRYWRHCRARSLIELARWLAGRIRMLHGDDDETRAVYAAVASRLERLADKAWDRL